MGRESFFFKIPSNHISAWQCVSNIVFSPSDCTSEHCKMYEVYPHYCIFPLYRKYHQTEHYDKMTGENVHLINTQKVPVNKITLSSTPSKCYSTDVLSFTQSFTQSSYTNNIHRVWKWLIPDWVMSIWFFQHTQ